MEEQIDILDETGEKTGEIKSYNDIHRFGLLHRTVHVWLLNFQNQVLLQKRSKNKTAAPGCWDVSVGGHISSGESSLEAAQRETKEEIGLTLPSSSFLFLFTVRHPITKHKSDFIDNEFNDVYLVRHDTSLSELKLQPEEVDEIRWLSIDEFRAWTKGKGEALTLHGEEYTKLLEYLLTHAT